MAIRSGMSRIVSRLSFDPNSDPILKTGSDRIGDDNGSSDVPAVKSGRLSTSDDEEDLKIGKFSD
jgi:hypothetical protein